MNNLICCCSGHRMIPPDQRDTLRVKFWDAALQVCGLGVTRFRVGGAIGFDALAAETLIELRNQFPHLDITLYKPFEGYFRGWSEGEIATYNKLLPLYNRIVVVCDPPPKSRSYAYLKRDRYLVDGSTYLIAYCNKRSGGTAYTLRCAQKTGCHIINIAHESERQTVV